MLNVRVYITLKKTIADPQGLTVKHAMESLGYKQAKDVRMGKLIDISIDSDNIQKTKDSIDQMCKKLLANPIIEDYKIEITDNK